MNKRMAEDEAILMVNGWNVTCYSPFEIQTKDGSFASGEAAYIVLEYLRPKNVDPKYLLSNLDPNDKQYFNKLNILHTLICHPGVNSAIETSMRDWCEGVGLKTTLNGEGDTTWWTVQEKQKEII